MSAIARWWEVTRREVLSGLRRPAYWVLFVLLALLAWGFSEGGVTISSGDSTIGGEQAHVTSMFGQGMIQTVLIMGFGAWFLAIAAGLVVIRDLELGVVELFHSTRLTPREYVWGKFAGALGIFLVVWLLYLGFAAGLNHIVEGGDAEHIGTFALGNYLYPTLLFGLPQILLFAGVPFFLGTWTRQPIVVFAFPVAVLLFTLFFLTTWSPDWLSPETNRLLMLLDPSGFRWLNETFLTVDRGVSFYNSAPIQPDTGFLLSRAAFGVLGLAAVAGATRSYVGRLRRGGSDSRVARFFRRRRERREGSLATLEPSAASLRGLDMATRPLGFWNAAQAIGREEIRELIRRPGMYLFVPLILWQAVQNSLFAIGPFNSQILLTPGVMAARQLNTLALLICVLLLFYTVESLHKERGRQLAEIFNSTPIPTGSILLGKTIGNSLVAGLILLIGVIACAVVMLYRQLFQGSPVGFDVVPFVVTWGGVLVPTFIFWTALVTALFALFRNRYAVYAVGLFLIIYTAVRMTFLEPFGWPLNWMAWNAVQWTDMGTFSLNGRELLLNRILYLSLVPLLVFMAVKWFGRQDRDPTRVLHRIRPKPILLGTPRVLAFAAPAIVLASVLFFGGRAGRQGEATEEAGKDYWRENVATWNDFEMPSVSDVDVELDFEPAERSVAVDGEYTFYNHRDYAFEDIPVTAGQWDPIEWTLNGEPHEPDDRSNLFVFTPDDPLGPGDSLTIGFSYELEFPQGMSKEAGGAGQFILESGIVLTAFTPTFLPTPGYLEGIGVDDDNSSEPQDYADDFFEGETEPLFGWGGEPFTVRTQITLPEEYTANGVGRKVSDQVADGRRTVVWETDHPVVLFNVVAGKYAVKEGDGTAIYYHPEHDYNIEEMSAALDAAREYYSEWFYPFPWDLLKISEFAAFATYAQGFPTNITFSEGIGFLARSDPRSHIAFMVVAHEAAHQWWGNLLTPGQGPGGNIISEGMAHYSTMLLHEQVYGDRYRIEFAKRLEQLYGDTRFVDSERPMVETDGTRPGDGTVTYDKGGWVPWMLQQEMGRENMLAGLQAFIAKYNPDSDFPVLQDMVAVLRDFAPDTAAFDAFTEQWFFEVVVPEYEFSDVTKTEEGGEWVVRGTVENVGTGRMRVQVGATAGERWSDEGEDGSRTVVNEDYRDARTEVELGAGESAEFVIRATFEPERVLIDPDVLVLQLNRDAALFEW
ncbi:MAG: M1 family aminopeptidase [Gemmatimonadetes bacterium]|nr:M1 family aminopeptidase [Gemmatimonadota bacterium]MCY3677256.1 M1 family aminopeptidase [Gemmatimonadota bacterium]MYA44062.1 hypothetical protein [Gemmatimonadota bacterium]MYE94694.1 hypothetical protein [Gemmatimonadota bacterium]MYJ12500.1 hypothetical protein [Gemmatimonadota bacterium]